MLVEADDDDINTILGKPKEIIEVKDKEKQEKREKKKKFFFEKIFC